MWVVNIFTSLFGPCFKKGYSSLIQGTESFSKAILQQIRHICERTHILKLRRHWPWLSVIKLGTYICFLKSRWKRLFSKFEPCNIFRLFVGSTYGLRPKAMFHFTVCYCKKIIHMLHCQSMLSLNPGQRGQYSEWRGAGRFGDRVPVGAEIYRTRSYRPWGSPHLLHIGYRIITRVKRGVFYPPISSTEVKERVQLYFYFPSGSSRPVIR